MKDGEIHVKRTAWRTTTIEQGTKTEASQGAKKANIPWCGWHGFRRGLATNLHTLDVNDLDIQRIMRPAMWS